MSNSYQGSFFPDAKACLLLLLRRTGVKRENECQTEKGVILQNTNTGEIP